MLFGVAIVTSFTPRCPCTRLREATTMGLEVDIEQYGGWLCGGAIAWYYRVSWREVVAVEVERKVRWTWS